MPERNVGSLSLLDPTSSATTVSIRSHWGCPVTQRGEDTEKDEAVTVLEQSESTRRAVMGYLWAPSHGHYLIAEAGRESSPPQTLVTRDRGLILDRGKVSSSRMLQTGFPL